MDREATEGARLALVVGDARAMRVLAAWACSRLYVADVDARLDAVVATIEELVDDDPDDIEILLRRLRATGCLRDGGISDMADRVLQTITLTGAKARTK